MSIMEWAGRLVPGADGRTSTQQLWAPIGVWFWVTNH